MARYTISAIAPPTPSIGEKWEDTACCTLKQWDGYVWRISPITGNYAEYYVHENVNATNVQAANQWVGLKEMVQGTIGGNWTFDAGKQIAITAYANNGDGKTEVTSNAHGLSNGDIVTISGTTSYNGVWVIEQKTDNTFVIDTGWVADDGASTGENPSRLIAGAGAAGTYLMHYNFTLTPSNNNDVMEIALHKGETYLVNMEGQDYLKGIGQFSVVAGAGFATIAAGDQICAVIKNLSGANDITIRNANITIECTEI